MGVTVLSIEVANVASPDATNGTYIVRRRGAALFRFDEYVGGADVIFGDPGDATLLGALTLESLGLSLDPIRRELKPMDLLL